MCNAGLMRAKGTTTKSGFQLGPKTPYTARIVNTRLLLKSPLAQRERKRTRECQVSQSEYHIISALDCIAHVL